MSVQTDVLARAASRIGYYAPNDPEPGSESGRYWANRGKGAWLAGPSTSIWWCMLFVSMCLDEVGQMDSIGGFSYNTDVTIRQARAAGCQFVSVANAQPGDVVIYNWTGDAFTDHVGFVEKNLGGGRLQTIEGNTSSGAAGSQSAGNGVWRRVRSAAISHIIRPKYSGSSSAPSWYLEPDGVWGDKSRNRFNEVMGLPQGTGWGEGCARMQQFLNQAVDAYAIHSLTGDYKLVVDGVDGERTWKVYQYWWNRSKIPAGRSIEVDGVWGPDTCTAIQHSLNNSWAMTIAFARSR